MKKKILLLASLLFSLFICAQTAPIAGDGSGINPYQISTFDHLKWIVANPSLWNSFFIQTADIDASASSSMNESHGWKPIGNETTEFDGVYNGQGYKITNLVINDSTGNGLGFFGKTGSFCNISNLQLDNVNIIGYYEIGGLASFNFGTIDNCSVSGKVLGKVLGSTCIGLLVGKNAGNVNNCKSSGSIISAGNQTGGLIGENAYGFIKNCSSDAIVSGYDYVGGIVGLSSGGNIESSHFSGEVEATHEAAGGLGGYCTTTTIKACYSTGKVTGVSFSGGFIGWNYDASITNCYSNSIVSGGDNMGGFVGINSGSIANCFSTGNLDICCASGGFVGTNEGGSISNSYSIGNVKGGETLGAFAGRSYAIISKCFWNNETAGQAIGIGENTDSFDAIGLKTDSLKVQRIFTDKGWNFTNDGWFISSSLNNGYPAFSWQLIEAPSIGNGTVADPYQISTISHLFWLSANPSVWVSNFIQTADIDASITKIWDEGKGWSPVGSYEVFKFTGNYNGQYHKISNLYINRNTTSNIGFFGYINTGAKVSNLGLENVDITGGDNAVGGLVGQNDYGEITNCFVSGKVSGVNQVGGLEGNANFNNVSKCFTNVAIIGTGDVGGFSGNNNIGTITNSYSIGSVVGESNVGGFIGYNNGSHILTSYSTCGVTGSTTTGGFSGRYNSWLNTNNNFWDIETCGQTSGYGINIKTFNVTGKTTTEMKSQTTFTNAGWDFSGETVNGSENIWSISSGVNNGYPYLTWQSSTPTELENFSIYQINMYPNPVKNKFSVQGFEGLAYLAIYNLSGILLIEKSVFENESVNVNNLNEGVYILKVKYKNKTEIIKFVVY